MSFPCSFSSSSLLTVPGAFFRAVARACAMVIFGLAVVVDANAPRATTLARVTAVVSFLIMPRSTRRRCMALHKFQVNEVAPAGAGAGALAGAALDLLAAEIRDRAGEPGPRRADSAALLEEEAPRLLDQLLGVGGGEAVAAARDRAQRADRRRVHRLEVVAAGALDL